MTNDEMKLKEKDKCILHSLLENGRISFADLGRICGMSRQGAFERVKQLQREGIIESFTVRLNEEKLGLSFRAYMLISAKPSENLRKNLVEFLQKNMNVRKIQMLFGRYDFFLELLFRRKEEMTDFIKQIHTFDAVERTETFIVYQTLKDRPELPLLMMLSPPESLPDG